MQSQRSSGRVSIQRWTILGLVCGWSVLSGMGWADNIGQTKVRLDTLNADKQETTFGYLATDAFRSTSGADIALINASAFLPGSINPGPIASDQVAALFKFPDDRLVMADLTGDVIRRMLERSVSVYPAPNEGFLHVSGLRVTFDPRKPMDNRIIQVDVIAGGHPGALDPNRSYRVVTSTTIGRGGLGYFKIVGPNPKITKMNTTVVAAITEHLRSTGPVQYGNERRIVAQ